MLVKIFTLFGLGPVKNVQKHRKKEIKDGIHGNMTLTEKFWS